jgi:hypothetical protein
MIEPRDEGKSQRSVPVRQLRKSAVSDLDRCRLTIFLHAKGELILLKEGALIEVGAHTVTHSFLGCIAALEQRQREG